jgi:hypothetical protein
MRLIDADKLLEHYACGDVTGIPEEDIRLAPTVDAITIEWLVEWMTRNLNDEADIQVIQDLIDDWRKENETYK